MRFRKDRTDAESRRYLVDQVETAIVIELTWPM